MEKNYLMSDYENNKLSKIADIILIFDPTKYNHATGKNYVDNTTGESKLVRKKY